MKLSEMRVNAREDISERLFDKMLRSSISGLKSKGESSNRTDVNDRTRVRTVTRC